MYEHRKKPLLTKHLYKRRLALHGLAASALIFFSLAFGVLGYRYFENLPWIDALLNASMLLGGMGPINPLQTTAGKLFASFYALFSGIIFLVGVGILFAPVLHRLIHEFHWEIEDDVMPKEKTKK